MSYQKKVTIFIVSLIIIIFLIWKLLSIQTNEKDIAFAKKQSELLIGTYVFSHVCIGEKLLPEYKLCSLKIKNDGTFQFNKDFNFLYDSIGSWKPRERSLYSWNKFTFSKKSFKISNSKISMDVGGIYDKNDSLLQLNSITPKPHCITYANCIYMKKLKNK